jgi:predicted nucleic acid-binding protein
MIALDTNILSAIMQEEPDPFIAAWLDQHPIESLWITTITIFEIRYGIEVLETGRRRRRLEDTFERALVEDFQERILPVDEMASRAAASIAARRRRAGRIGQFQDTLIAGIAIARHAEIATRNVRHFDDLGIRVINPWSE